MDINEPLLKNNEGWIDDFPKFRRPDLQAFFERWATDDQFLFHGSNQHHLEKLLPYEANCITNIEGNLNAVYATDDLDLALYYAILDKNKWKGFSIAEKQIKGNSAYYRFALEKDILIDQPFSSGRIYTTLRSDFRHILLNNSPTFEWYLTKPSAIIDSIEVFPVDFKFLESVIPLPNSC